jgi:hypothetical protein
LHSTGAAALAGSEALPRSASKPAAAPAILPARAAQFRTHRRPPKVDPSPHAITPDERAYIDDRIQAGCAPRADLIRKMLRLCAERKLTLDRVRRVIDQARAMPSRYPGAALAGILDNILRGDDDLG